MISYNSAWRKDVVSWCLHFDQKLVRKEAGLEAAR